jgi:sterol desaturase/sphingolipid hydroxylase (fatty acid hydroxylase superfamily)
MSFFEVGQLLHFAGDFAKASVITLGIGLMFTFLQRHVLWNIAPGHKVQKEAYTLLPKKFWYELYNCVIGPGAAGYLMGKSFDYLENIGVFQVDRELGWDKTGSIAFQFVVYFLFFDLWFYVVHRFLFHSKTFWWIHRPHHESFTPNPLSGFSFTITESILTGGVGQLFLRSVFRYHVLSPIVVNIWGLSNTVLTHLGFEIFPLWFHKIPILKHFMIGVAHDFHHSKVHFNFGGFTTFYDDWFGTTYSITESIESMEKLQNSTEKPVEK